MKKIEIVTDSNAGIDKELAEKLGVTIIPMPFFINDEEYFENVNLSQDKFFQLLRQDVEIMTAQPSAYDLKERFKKMLENTKSIVYIPMSSGLSGSCETAKALCKDFGGKVVVVDNTRISVTLKESVFEALKMAEKGKNAVEIKTYLEKTSKLSSVYIMVDDLKYLKKGGRINPAAALIGSVLKIKPVLTSDGGKFERLALARTVKQAQTFMIQAVEKDIEGKLKEVYEKGCLVMSVAHTNNYENALSFAQELQDRFPSIRFGGIDSLSLSVTCHIGEGALAVALAVDNYLD